MSLDLWNDLAATSPDVNGNTAEFEYCELVVNGYYGGIYGLVRPVDGETLAIDDDENARFYQFNLDFNDAATAQYIEDPLGKLPTLAELKYPKEFQSDADLWSPLIRYCNLFCANLREPTLADLEAMFNQSNAIDYSLFTACASGYDNLYKNMYMIWRQDTDGKYRFYRVPWDLDFTFGDYYGDVSPLHMIFSMNNVSDSRLTHDMQDWLALDSGEMKQAFYARWKELRASLFSESALQARMAEQVAILQQNGAYQRDDARWKESPASADLTNTFAFLHARLAFLDRYFAELTQSSPSE
ncbi:hypothetical protein SDC9_132420 [bioreactor metagenome]|uniref:Inner spore coat protein H n=1 Tax=bioreactor metagenome TaxID=1076179 RepID=A0A645D9P6_9ZZZZ